jgi:hypothetical protein
LFDVGQNLKYPLDDEKWAEKILIGGALNVIPIINFFSMGYTLESMRAGTRGETTLPEWQDWGDKFVAGLMVFVISFAYMLVPSILMCLGAGGLVGMMHFGDVGWGIAGGGLTLLTFLIIIALAFILPMALAHFVAEDRIGAAFEFGEVWRRIRTVFGDYLVAIVLFMVLSVILGTLFVIPILGWIVFLFGVFYLGVAFANLIGRLYHQASAGNSTSGIIR